MAVTPWVVLHSWHNNNNLPADPGRSFTAPQLKENGSFVKAKWWCLCYKMYDIGYCFNWVCEPLQHFGSQNAASWHIQFCKKARKKSVLVFQPLHQHEKHGWTQPILVLIMLSIFDPLHSHLPSLACDIACKRVRQCKKRSLYVKWVMYEHVQCIYIYNYIYTIYMKVTAPPQPQPLFLSGTVFQMGQKNFTPRRSSLRRHPSSEIRRGCLWRPEAWSSTKDDLGCWQCSAAL